MLTALRRAARTVGALGLLTVPLPVTAAVTTTAWVTSRTAPAVRTALGLAPVPGSPAATSRPRTVLVSGGKMTKALALARAFHAAGHRVVLVESARYRFTGHRFSRAVDAFHVVPPPDEPGYAEALRDVVLAEGVDVYVPVCSPAASIADARAKALLEGHCEVVHPDPDVLATLDDKDSFAAAAEELGLRVPETIRVESPDDVAAVDFAAPGRAGRRYILKSIAYDPIARLDLTRLPLATAAATKEFAASKPISPSNPWILQEFVEGREYCTHSTVRDGRTQVWACCESSAFQLNYAMADGPAAEAVRAWVTRYVDALGVTGQVSFDLIAGVRDPGGPGDVEVFGIECNPRTHSAITMFHDHPDLAAAYLDDLSDGEVPLVPVPGSRPTYWLYQELWRMVSTPSSAPERLRVLVTGTDAIFSWSDPLPFLLVHHLQLPSLLLGDLVRGRDWIRIDPNIGKLVEPAGD